MQNASKRLLSQITDSVFDICTGSQIEKINERVSKLLSAYNVSVIPSDSSHPDLYEKIEMFFAGKRLEGLSEITLYDYGLQLRLFANFVNKQISDITTDDIRAWLGQYSNLKRSTVSTKLTTLKSFFGWLTQEEIIPRDPTKRIKTPKQESRLPKSLSIEELEVFRESCQTLRQRALVEVMYATGCRVSEVHSMDRDIDFATLSTNVIGKGNKEREVLFSVRSVLHLQKYLSQRDDDCPALFVTERKPYRRLSTRGIQIEIRKIAELSGIQKPISPHTLRHTFATLSLNNGADLFVLQNLLGHANPNTTQTYAVLDRDRIREQYRRSLVS